MITLGIFFEISDKIPSVQSMYVFFIILGGIGFLLGFWRWWLSLIWLIFPLSFFAVLFIWLQSMEINDLYENIVRELGENYIWHNYISVIVGVLLNTAGIPVSFFKPRKLVLQ